MEHKTEKKPNLLIVEDDYENQRFLQLFLRKYLNVDVCDSSESFYEKMNLNKYDILLMDISIKGKKNGLELTQELKNNSDTSSIPIICYTAHALHKDRLNALDAGCDVYISKPSDIYYLLNSIFLLLQTRGRIISESFNLPGFATT
jgi:DNA-binding response OmpR family regulator